MDGADQGAVRLGLRRVEPGWIDYNGHMNVTYYTQAFDQALDEFFELHLGHGPEAVKASGLGPFALQAQYHYLAELKAGEAFFATVRVLEADAKRVHVFCELREVETGRRSATLEQVILTVDLERRKAAALPEAVQARARALVAAQDGVPRPAEAGAPIRFRRGGG